MLLNLLRCGYRVVFRTVLSRMDPETAHGLGASVIRWLGGCSLIARPLRRWFGPDPSLKVTAMGLEFPSPFGVAAGFDKNAKMVDGLRALGFGHVEVGTVTPIAQPGNPRPRMYRLPKDRALINRMGFNNEGVVAVAQRLRDRRTGGVVVGVNIGKNKTTAAEHAVDDYVSAAMQVRDVADYLVINVSSPNTPGLRGLQELDALEPILRRTLAAADGVPLLLKIAPDLDDAAIARICELVTRIGLDGIVCTNTTIAREPLTTSRRVVEAYGAGGLSGAPLAERSFDVLRIVRANLPDEACIISVGGVTDAVDVVRRLDAGATLVQGYTAFLYEGPAWAAKVNRDLAKLLRTSTVRHMSTPSAR